MYRYYNDFFDSKNYCDETVYAFYLELCQRGGRVAPLLIEVVTGDYISDNIHVPSNDFQVCLLTPEGKESRPTVHGQLHLPSLRTGGHHSRLTNLNLKSIIRIVLTCTYSNRHRRFLLGPGQATVVCC